jgi:chemotaxis protein MotB
MPVRLSEPRRRGGAWKVAYADFVTALMALFIALWVLNSGQGVRQAVSGYFRDPRGYTRKMGAGPAGSGEGLAVSKNNLNDIRSKVEQSLSRAPEFARMRPYIKVSVTGEGLRIDLMETEHGMFFVTGSPRPTPAGENLLRLLADEIGKMPNGVVVEGHTDARPFRNSEPAKDYGNWDLSTERANAARRVLQSNGVGPDQVVEVRGFAERKLLNAADPNDPRNRRVSLVVQFMAE